MAGMETDCLVPARGGDFHFRWPDGVSRRPRAASLSADHASNSAATGGSGAWHLRPAELGTRPTRLHRRRHGRFYQERDYCKRILSSTGNQDLGPIFLSVPRGTALWDQNYLAHVPRRLDRPVLSARPRQSPAGSRTRLELMHNTSPRQAFQPQITGHPSFCRPRKAWGPRTPLSWDARPG